MNGASQLFLGKYASQKLSPNQILSYFDVISYCEKKSGTHVSNVFDGVCPVRSERVNSTRFAVDTFVLAIQLLVGKQVV